MKRTSDGLLELTDEQLVSEDWGLGDGLIANVGGHFKYQRDIVWIVECGCGATDDDREKMIECEKCRKWSHTDCLGVTEFNHYTCLACSAAVVLQMMSGKYD